MSVLLNGWGFNILVTHFGKKKPTPPFFRPKSHWIYHTKSGLAPKFVPIEQKYFAFPEAPKQPSTMSCKYGKTIGKPMNLWLFIPRKQHQKHVVLASFDAKLQGQHSFIRWFDGLQEFAHTPTTNTLKEWHPTFWTCWPTSPSSHTECSDLSEQNKNNMTLSYLENNGSHCTEFPHFTRKHASNHPPTQNVKLHVSTLTCAWSPQYFFTSQSPSQSM